MRSTALRLALPCLFFLTPAWGQAASNVILITLKGVRWEEVFQGVDESKDPEGALGKGPIFSFTRADYGRGGILLGSAKGAVTTSSWTRHSTPGIRAILSGQTSFCFFEDCGRVGIETLPERLVRELGLERSQVASFSSRQQEAENVEHRQGTITVNAGPTAFEDDFCDEELESINRLQLTSPPPWDDARYDQHTFAQARRYLRRHKPRFLFLSLNDANEWAQRGSYERYVTALRTYDSWIEELSRELEGMGEYGRETLLVVTTDHGRGSYLWKNAGGGIPDSRIIWHYLRLPGSQGPAHRVSGTYTQDELRPTIERLLGLAPSSSRWIGEATE